MAWQEGNLNRFQTSIQAMDAASQARKRGADTLTDRMKMLQQTGLQMGQWNQDKMRQYRDEWAKAYAKDPNIGTFQNWYKQVSGKQPLTEMFKGANLENALSGEGGNVVQKTSLPGAGYEGAFQKGIMETETDQRERAWGNYKNTLEAEGKVKYDDLNPEQQRRIRLEFEKGYAPEGWGGWGYTDKDQDQGINAIMRDAYQFYKAENQKLDEFGNPIWKGTQPTKDQVINAMYNQIKDEPQFAALFKGAAAKDRIRKYVESVYGREEVIEPEPVAVEKNIIKPKNVPWKLVTQGASPRESDKIRPTAEDIINGFAKIKNNPEKYQEDMPLVQQLINEYQQIVTTPYRGKFDIERLEIVKRKLYDILMPKFEASESYRYGTGPVPGTSQTTTNAPKQYQTPFLP